MQNINCELHWQVVYAVVYCTVSGERTVVVAQAEHVLHFAEDGKVALARLCQHAYMAGRGRQSMSASTMRALVVAMATSRVERTGHLDVDVELQRVEHGH